MKLQRLRGKAILDVSSGYKEGGVNAMQHCKNFCIPDIGGGEGVCSDIPQRFKGKQRLKFSSPYTLYAKMDLFLKGFHLNEVQVLLNSSIV